MSLQLSECKVPCLLCNMQSSRISCIHYSRNQNWAIVHRLFLCIHLSDKQKDFWPRKGNRFCYYARIGKSTNVSYPRMTIVLYKTETTRKYFSDCGCVSNYEDIGTFPWRQQVLLLVRSMQTSMDPPTLYTPRSPLLQCWKLKWKRWQELKPRTCPTKALLISTLKSGGAGDEE